MAQTLPWFRVYSEIMHDPKLRRISRTTRIPKATLIGVWISLLALANESDQRGRLTIAKDKPITMDDLEDETGIDQGTIDKVLTQFLEFDMITQDTDGTIEITNWDGRQFKSDSSYERVKRFRDKQRDEQDENCNVSETLHETQAKRYSNAVDTDTDTETDTELISVGEPAKFQEVWESETGKPVAALQQFITMVKEFNKAGVTPDIYRQAIKEQSQSTYSVTNPASVKNWALKLANPKKSPGRGAHSAEEINAGILKEIENGTF